MREFQIGDIVSGREYGHEYTAKIVAYKPNVFDPYLLEAEESFDVFWGGWESTYGDEEVYDEFDNNLYYLWTEAERLTLVSNPGVNYKLIKTEFLQGVEL